MSRAGALLGSALFLLVAPGVMGGLVPWWLTGWSAGAQAGPLLAVPGWLLVAAGVAALLHAFGLFALEGRGTPAPVAQTEFLVLGGLYRHVRNPMYVAVTAIILGTGLVLARPVLLVYAAVFLAVTASFVRFYEEPTLTEQFGASYEEYRTAVPGWWPRLRPWRPEAR